MNLVPKTAAKAAAKAGARANMSVSIANLEVIADKERYQEEMRVFQEGVKVSEARRTFLIGVCFPPILVLTFRRRYRRTQNPKVKVWCKAARLVLLLYFLMFIVCVIMIVVSRPYVNTFHRGQVKNPDSSLFTDGFTACKDGYVDPDGVCAEGT